MNIFIAENAGFCFGVKRAVEIAYNEIIKNSDNNIYSLGELIHNPQVVEDLSEKGVKHIEEIDIEKLKPGDKIIIRTHGISKLLYNRLKEKNVKIIDVTCPFVKKVQDIVNDYHLKGYNIIIIGDKTHPEVQGVNGWCDNSAYVVNSIDEALNISEIGKGCVVAQTTITEEMWQNIISILNNKIKEPVYFNTICDATQKRQKAAYELSQKVDTIIVIGGKNSSNTQKLKKICEKNCNKTYHIEKIEEINYNMVKDSNNIGITAGASTPDYLIDEVVAKIKLLRKD